jgi:hypothetical protein
METLQKGDRLQPSRHPWKNFPESMKTETTEVEIDTNTKVIMERSGISMEYTGL